MMAMVDSIAQLWTWQTPLSFLAGVGAHHLWCKFWRDKEERQQDPDD